MRYSLLILAVGLLGFTQLNAQRGTDNQDRNWWVGAHTNLGFGANTQQISYTLGIAPMFGYRVLPYLSVGPRASVLYRHVRLRDIGGNLIQTFNLVDNGLGGFVRAEVFRQYFAQAELVYESLDTVDPTFGRINGFNSYIGLGMNSGGRNPSFEIMLLYDLNLQAVFKQNLLNYRFGFTLYY